MVFLVFLGTLALLGSGLNLAIAYQLSTGCPKRACRFGCIQAGGFTALALTLLCLTTVMSQISSGYWMWTVVGMAVVALPFGLGNWAGALWLWRRSLSLGSSPDEPGLTPSR